MRVHFRSAKTAVIAELLQNDRMSRLGLSERAGVSPAAITEVTQALLQQGLLLELPDPLAGTRRGRPTVQLSLDASHACFVGISVGEEGTTLALTDMRGSVIECQKVGAFSALEEMGGAVQASFAKALRSSGVSRSLIRGAGVAVAGIMDAEAGVCRYSAALDWRDAGVAEIVSRALKLPAWADNDANAVAVGEKIFGQAREYNDFSSIVIGRTIGSAHYMHGMLYRGHDGSAGEIGHITVEPDGVLCRCGRHGCLDTVAGGFSLRRAAREHGLAVEGMRELEDLAMHGDATAIRLLREAGTALGKTVASLVHMNNPQAVLFTDTEGFENGVFRTATRQAVENGILPRFLGSTKIHFCTAEASTLPRSAASIAAFNYLIAV